MRTFILSLVIYCLLATLMWSGTVIADETSAAGKITFVKGEVMAGPSDALKPAKPGKAVALNDIVVTGSGAKVKILLEQSKMLVTILSDTKVRITGEGVELVTGSESNIKKKQLGVLKLNPQLTEKSSQLGGSFAMRSSELVLKTLNLDDTFIRETRPNFRWECNKEGSFVITLFHGASDGTKDKLWERQTIGDNLPFPGNETALEHGENYYWEIFELTSGESSVVSSQFYVLSEKEIEKLEQELRKLKSSLEIEEEDNLTGGYLRMDLLNKYYLKDEAEQLRQELEGPSEE